MNGFTEVLTWILCSKKENFEMLNRKDDKSTAAIIGNPRSSDFEVCISCQNISLRNFSYSSFLWFLIDVSIVGLCF